MRGLLQLHRSVLQLFFTRSKFSRLRNITPLSQKMIAFDEADSSAVLILYSNFFLMGYMSARVSKLTARACDACWFWCLDRLCLR
jgi:hypothetical protein